jgi:type VI protein secretion system component Hcp
MPLLMQVFDNLGNAVVQGDTTFKDHVNWVTVSSWNFRRDSSDPVKIGELLFTTAAFPDVASMQASMSGTSKVGWSRAVLDWFRDDDNSDAPLVMRRTFTEPRITSMNLKTDTDGSGLWTFTMSFRGTSLEYVSPDPVDAAVRAMAVGMSPSP